MGQERDMEAVQTKAERWFIRLRAEECTAAERGDFDAWIASDPAHAHAYARTRQLWSDLGELAEDGDVARWRHEMYQSIGPGTKRARPSRRRWVLAAVASLIMVMFASGGFGWWWLSGISVADYATARGKQRSVSLNDGTRVILNTATVLEVHLNRRSRRVQLRQGEAVFEVTHDADRPFVVRAGDATITDIGTRFNVRRENKRTVVTVVKGAVAVARDGRTAELGSGEQLVAGESLWRKRRVDLATVTSWTRGKLVFRAAPLREVVLQVNRYGPDHLVIGDPSLDSLRISGQFRIGNTDALVRALRSAFPIRAIRTPLNEIHLYRKKSR